MSNIIKATVQIILLNPVLRPLKVIADSVWRLELIKLSLIDFSKSQ